MSKCTKCKVCEHSAVMNAFPTGYPEDSKGVPYCNSEGPLSERNREILSRREVVIKSVHAAQTGPFA